MAFRVMVTGSLGYLGSRLCPFLSARGVECVGYDTGFFKDCTLSLPEDPRTVFKDVRMIDAHDLEGIEVVIHLAGISNDPVGALPPEQVYDPTRAYTKRLAMLCRARGIRFIFASSCSVYGVNHAELVTEASETSPQTPYSLNKLQIEQDLASLGDGRFVPIILRLATVFGFSPRIRFDIVVNMLVGMAVAMRKIVLNSDGSAWRPHVHVEDVCEAIHACLKLDPPTGAPLILNVGDTIQNFQIFEVAQSVRAEVPGCELTFLQSVPEAGSHDGLELIRDRKIRDGVDHRTYRVSFERIRQVLSGFRCRWSVADGIRDLVARLQALGLTPAQFQDRRFYRLQTLETWLRAGRLTEDLRWKPLERLAASARPR